MEREQNAKRREQWVFRLSMALFAVVFLTGAVMTLSSFLSSKEDTELLERPETGYVLRNTGEPSASSILVDTVEGMDYLVKMDGKSGENEVVFYIRGGEKASIYVAPDEYTVKFACGTDWAGLKDRFGPETMYKQVDRTFLFTGAEGWNLMLYFQQGDNARITAITEENF